eukprot:m.211691 g.211691  ORF g.211691 m.211691 type:complete len:161 (+) comp13785_c3_seq55:2110-2592(+)
MYVVLIGYLHLHLLCKCSFFLFFFVKSVKGGSLQTEFVSVGLDPTNKKLARFQAAKGMGPYSLRLTKLDKKGIVLRSSSDQIPPVGTPERHNVMIMFSMSRIGFVVFTVKFRGREAIFHIEQKFEDLLYDVDEERPVMKLGELLELDAKRMLVLLDKTMF